MILAFLLIGLVLLLALCAYGWRSKALRRAQEAQGLGLLAANLEGQLKQSEAKAEKMAEIAKRAIEVAAEKYDAPIEWPPSMTDSLSPVLQYTIPEVKYCVCNVSIRSNVWPVPCPSCGAIVGDILDADLIE